MYGKTRITLSRKEISYATLALKMEVDRNRRFIETIGDPDGSRRKEVEEMESLIEKLEKARIRTW